MITFSNKKLFHLLNWEVCLLPCVSSLETVLLVQAHFPYLHWLTTVYMKILKNRLTYQVI